MLVPSRPIYLTQQHDRFLRSHYFPGLSVSQLAQDFRTHFLPGFPRKGWINNPLMVERIIANRLSDLGLRNRMQT